jgi:hypothetical protein
MFSRGVCFVKLSICMAYAPKKEFHPWVLTSFFSIPWVLSVPCLEWKYWRKSQYKSRSHNSYKGENSVKKINLQQFNSDRTLGPSRSRSSGWTLCKSYLGPSGEPPMARTTRWRCWWRRRRLVGLVRHPVASAPPSRSARVLEWGLWWRRQTSWSEPVAPTPSYSVARQGPTNLLTGWASPIRTWVKIPMGRWAHW